MPKLTGKDACIQMKKRKKTKRKERSTFLKKAHVHVRKRGDACIHIKKERHTYRLKQGTRTETSQIT